MTLDVLILAFLFLSNALILSQIAATRTKTERRLKRIEFCVDLIGDHLQVDRFPEGIKEIALDPDPRQRLKTVRLYREKTGADLQEAIAAVEKFSGRNFKP